MYTYHGPERSRSPTFLASHDVVLTSYSVLGQDLGDGRGLLRVNWLRVVLDEVGRRGGGGGGDGGSTCGGVGA